VPWRVKAWVVAPRVRAAVGVRVLVVMLVVRVAPLTSRAKLVLGLVVLMPTEWVEVLST
jgi:hypothetical protein